EPLRFSNTSLRPPPHHPWRPEKTPISFRSSMAHRQKSGFCVETSSAFVRWQDSAQLWADYLTMNTNKTSDSPAISVLVATRLRKTASDNGFDLDFGESQGRWLEFGSSQVRLRLWLTTSRSRAYIVALSQSKVANALGCYGQDIEIEHLPDSAQRALGVDDIPSLDRLIRRAFQLSGSLPDEPFKSFQGQTSTLPRATEAERRTIQRIGQSIFRQGLLAYWEGSCAVTDLAEPKLLKASHIKPWAQCLSDEERLDVFNGLLLSPNLDAAFDCGLITFGDQGLVCFATAFAQADRKAACLHSEQQLKNITPSHRIYLDWHRENVFQG
ncbi:hypothetical protein AC249_AIPGENE24940, partial [Exaiptasia diaphana]